MRRTTHVDSKRNVILLAAARLFANRGAAGTTVWDIGRAAGVTDAAIYKHFSGKDELAQAVYSMYIDRYVQIISTAAELTGTFQERLDALVAVILRLHEEDRCGLLLLPEACRYGAGSHRQTPLEAMATFINTGVAAGELPPQDPRVTAAMFFGAIQQAAAEVETGRLPLGLTDTLPQIQERLRGLLGISGRRP